MSNAREGLREMRGKITAKFSSTEVNSIEKGWKLRLALEKEV